MPLTITPLGRVSGMPKQGNAASGYVVTDGTTTVLLDAGPGVALMLSGAAPIEQLDAIVVTHMHIDHVYDLLAVAKMVLATRLVRGPEGVSLADGRTIPAFVPAGGSAALRQHAALFPVVSNPLFDQAFDHAVTLTEYQPGSRVEVGSLTIDLVELAHVVTDCGVRVTSRDGHALAFTGDTGWTPALLDLARDVDLLVCENTLTAPDTSGHGHLCAAEAGRAAAMSAAGHLMLTHFWSVDPSHLADQRGAAASEYDGPITIAVPGEPVTTSHASPTH
ncbi:MBL fold metallo-hydrolase [Propionibacteriaceae bacterium G1746]|uniref:MBL fold metallo-hydrolase n=1 Tax=Aestuariimicrobium sp. G57 TaxID=3418485 RepID=UPI003C1D09C2